MKENLGLIATFITAIGYIPYIFQTFSKHNKPHRTTWLALSILGLVSFLSYKEIGATITLGIAFVNTVGPFFVFCLSLKFGQGWENIKDLIYLVGSVIALALWFIFESAFIGLVFNLVADFIAFLPTIVKAYRQPHTEDVLSWFLFVFGAILGIFGLQNFSLQILIYPLYIIFAEGLVLFFVLRGRILVLISRYVGFDQ